MTLRWRQHGLSFRSAHSLKLFFSRHSSFLSSVTFWGLHCILSFTLMLQSLLLEELPTEALNHTLSGLPGFPLESGWDPPWHPNCYTVHTWEVSTVWMTSGSVWMTDGLLRLQLCNRGSAYRDRWLNARDHFRSSLSSWPCANKGLWCFLLKAKPSKQMKTFVFVWVIMGGSLDKSWNVWALSRMAH